MILYGDRLTIREWLARQREQLAAGPRTLQELARVAGVDLGTMTRAARGGRVTPRIATRIELAAREYSGAVTVARKNGKTLVSIDSITAKENPKNIRKRVAVR